MNRAFLDDRAARYLHRKDFTQEDFDTAVQAATIEIGQRLKSQSNEVRLDVVAGDWSDPQILPTDYRNMRTIEYAGQRGQRSLSAVSRDFMNKYAAQGGAPAFYSILAGFELHVRPYQAQDYSIFYWQEPAELSQEPDSTNPVLEAYPQMYLYRVVAELGFLTQDLELAKGYLSLFDDAVGRVNMTTKNANLGHAPAMRAI